MLHQVTEGKTEYRWQGQGTENRLAVTAKGLPTLPDDDSLDTFIVDHHWGYARTRQGDCIEYEVERRPWRTYPVGAFEVEAPEFAGMLSGSPISVVLAEGSKVSVSFGRRLSYPRA